MRPIPTAVTLALVLAWSAAFAGAASAQDPCGDSPGRGPMELSPASGAGRVALDAPVWVRYSPGYFTDPGIGADPATSIEVRVEETGEPVRGRAQVVGDRLYFQPTGLLAVNTRYLVTAYGVDFDFVDLTFTTGFAVDTTDPRLGEIERVSTDQVGETCEAPEGGWRVDVEFQPAVDDGSPGSIEYLLYQTRGPELEAPVLRGRARNFATGLVTMAFVLAPSESLSEVCVVVHAVDGVGRVDDDMTPRCFDPVQGEYFEPLCAVAAPGAPVDGPPALALAVGAALGLLARRRRAR